ncbi:MAG TPA: hypothetical protein VGO34_10880 [Alphaproteobacteria bacterium]|jgi:hypothetical protein
MTNRTLVGDLVTVTLKLTDLLTRENEILRSMRPQDIKGLQPEKTELARGYEHFMQELRNTPSLLAEGPQEQRDELREATMRFQKVMTDNERALRAARSVSERLMKAIVAAISEKQVSAAAYSSAGVLNSAGPRRAVAMTLNKQL